MKRACGHAGMSDNTVAISLTDPWSVAAIILFSLLATVAIYRSTRACCTCTLEDGTRV